MSGLQNLWAKTKLGGQYARYGVSISGISTKIRLTNVSDNTFSEKVIDSSKIGEGQLGITVPLYSAAEIDAKITVYYTDGKTADKIIPAIKIEPGKKTVIKGSLFSQNVTVNGEWGEDILISF